MGFMYWIRVVIMICAFVGVVFIMRQLDQTKSDSSANLCPTRVSELQMLGGPFFYQSGLKWVSRQNGQVAELDQIAMEKWFSQNCVLQITPVTEVTNAQPILRVSYVSGGPQTLMGSPDGFLWMGKKFKSEQLQRALSDLTEITSRH